MTTRYPIPAAETRVETWVTNSRFICAVAEARSVEDALRFIRRVKVELADASSHAYAHRVGFGSSVIDGCGDGGEPSGTAGRPMPAVLQGSGLDDEHFGAHVSLSLIIAADGADDFRRMLSDLSAGQLVLISAD